MVSLLIALTISASPEWKPVTEGIDYSAIRWDDAPVVGDGVLHVARIDPARAELVALAISREGKTSRTAGAWAKKHDLAVVINAGMYETDYSTHTGYLRIDGHENNGTWWKKYHSVLVFGPKKPGLTPAAIVDLDAQPSFAFDDYRVVVQNLRLIKAPGKNRWPANERQWSEAAIAIDGRGRLLFLFSRTPYSMREFNRRLLAADLDVRQAMHVEGGPEASLSIHGGGIDLDLAGSFETGFNANDGNAEQWNLPNVIGARPTTAR